MNEGKPGGGIENAGIIGGKPMGGGIPGMLGGKPGTGGMATVGGIGGANPPSIGGGSKGAVPISPGELVPAFGGSYYKYPHVHTEITDEYM